MTYHQFGHVDRDERIDYGEEPPPDDGRHAVRPRIPAAVVAVVVMAVFAGGLWFAYHEGAKHAATGAAEPDKVPLIHADSDPVKVKPDKVGGMDIPDRNDPIYGVRPGGGRGVEKLLPPPEAPVARPTAPPPPAAAPPQAAPQPQPLTPQQVAALAKPPAKPAAAGAGMRVQLASLRTPEAAREEWTRLKRDNDDLLGNLTAIAVRADLGERGIYYRVEAGPVADKTTAQRLCKALKERDLECHLVQ